MLAPMAGVTDYAYRILNRRHGCECAVTEMISARALYEDNKRTFELLKTCNEDSPLGIQLFGSDPYYFAHAIDKISHIKYDFLDLNAACPVKKIAGNGEGSALMKDPVKLEAILKILVDKSDKPVTVKIRAGWDESSQNAPEIAKLAQQCGVSAVFVHGRTRQQLYAGEVDLNIIAKTKKSVEIPVWGSGDVYTLDDIIRMESETGVDGVLIARGSYGNPWLFAQVQAYRSGHSIPLLPEVDVVADTMAMHLQMLKLEHGDNRAAHIFRKYFVWYTKGFRKVKNLRIKVFTLTNCDQILSEIEQFRQSSSRIL